MTAELDASILVGQLRLLYGDIGADSVRWKLKGFPFATDSAISLVTAGEICNEAVNAYNQQVGWAGTSSAVTQVYVARIGSTGYVVRYPQDRTGEWTMLYWFDSNWVFKQHLAG